MPNPTSVRRIGACATVCLLGAGVSAAGGPAAPVAPFRAAVEEHLAAVAARDMEALLPTITLGAELTMIAPNGFRLETREQYVDFHRRWFATEDGGRLDAEIVRVIESPGLSHALIRYRYTFRDETGTSRSSLNWLALTFALEEGRWRLVFDQNTPIDAGVDG